MSERTVMEVVSDIRKHCQTVELSILVDELVLLVAKTQADADRRAVNRERMRAKRAALCSTVQHCAAQTPPSPPMINNSTPSPIPDLAKAKSIKTPTENPLFEEFWGVYPRKVEKGVARKAWKNALKRATPEEIIAGAKRYAALKLDLEFTKHPGPWLNADRWLDEAPKVIEFASGPKRTWAEIKAEREGP
jgi:hypothetical protein